MINVTSPTTTLTFNASLPDGVFVGNIIVIVTAVNRFGRGTPSDPDYFAISKLSVCMRIILHSCCIAQNINGRNYGGFGS